VVCGAGAVERLGASYRFFFGRTFVELKSAASAAGIPIPAALTA